MSRTFSNPGGWPRIRPCEILLYDEVPTAVTEFVKVQTEVDNLSVNKREETKKEIPEVKIKELSSLKWFLMKLISSILLSEGMTC